MSINIKRAKLVVVFTFFLLAAAAFATLAFAQNHEDPRAAPHTTATAGAAGHEGPSAGAGAENDKHGSPHEGADAHHGPKPINWLDFSDKERRAFAGLLINFGLLAALYYTLGKKPIAQGLKQRRINIGKDIEEAQKLLDEAKELAKKYQSELKNADTDAATAKAGLIAAGKGEVERQLLEAEERADRMQRDAERLIEQEKKQIQQDLLVETINLAVGQAHKMLERAATPEDHARLANELLAELARKPAAPRVGGPPPPPPRDVGGAT